MKYNHLEAFPTGYELITNLVFYSSYRGLMEAPVGTKYPYGY
jgi:hypothetical protein